MFSIYFDFLLAVYILDIFMDNNMIRLWRLYLVALTAIRIAAKVEEKDFTLLRVGTLNACMLMPICYSTLLNDFVSFMIDMDIHLFPIGANYSKQDYNILESIMLRLFDWDINIPTALTFCLYYADFVVDETDFDNKHELYDCFEDFKIHIKEQTLDFVDLSLFGESI